MNVPIFPVMLVSAGALLMIFNILKSFALSREMPDISGASRTRTQLLLFLYRVLLLFFLAGYVTVGVSFFVPSILSVNETLIALIFFFGSVFVFIGIIMQLFLTRTIKQSNLEVTQALINAVEARDPNLNGHSLHVARLTMLIYQNLPKWCSRRIDKNDLEYAAMLHDIGKLGISEQILDKDGPLTDEEWKEIKKHPLIGKNILCAMHCFEEISDWILYHHERCDGKGYYELPFEEIPIPSRIISVADTFSAITMARSYHDAGSYEKAITILKDCRGTQLDPQVVDVFLKIPQERVEACRPEWVASKPSQMTNHCTK